MTVWVVYCVSYDDCEFSSATVKGVFSDESRAYREAERLRNIYTEAYVQECDVVDNIT